MISDPNHSAMEQYILTGERATWYKLCRISNHYRVEKTLIECSRFLEREAAKAGLPLHKVRGRGRTAHALSAVALGAAWTGVDVACCCCCLRSSLLGFAPQERVSHLNSMPDQIVDAHRAAGSPENGSPVVGPADSPRFAPDQTVAAAASSQDGASDGSNGGSDRDSERQRQRADRNSHHAAAAPSTGSGSSSNSSSRKKKKGRNAGAAAAAASSSAAAASATLGSDTEEVDDVLVSRDSEGEIAHTLTSQLLGSHRPSHAQRKSLGPLWKRGQDTDTDTNTDEELEEEEQARRRRYDPALSPSPNA